MKSSPSRYALASLAAGEAAEFAQSRGEIGPREGQGGGRVRGGGGVRAIHLICATKFPAYIYPLRVSNHLAPLTGSGRKIRVSGAGCA